MSAVIHAIEDHRNGEFTVNVSRGNRIFRKFTSVMDASKWLDLMKKSSRDELNAIYVTLCEVYITAKNEISYETCYVM